jgi:uncharacterized protein
MRKKIADSGLLIAALDGSDAFHPWAIELLQSLEPPWLVCEAVLAEVSASIGTAEPVMEMLRVDDLAIGFNLEAEQTAIVAILKKYRDQRIDLADACVVRMSELFPHSTVYTVDKRDFQIYRRHGNKPIPCVFP